MIFNHKTLKIYIIAIIVIILIGVIIAYQLDQNKQEEINIDTGTNIGELAPDFTLNKTNGEEISLSSLKGKKVLLNFWASWCPPCLEEMPDIQKLYKEHEDIEIIAVNMQEDRGKVINFLMTNNYTFPVVIDTNKKVAANYMVRAIPTSYILNKDGVIIDKITGVLNYQKILEILEIRN